MATLKVPENLWIASNIVDPNSERVEAKFCEWLLNGPLLDPAWSNTLASLTVCIELRALFKDAKPGDEITITADQLKHLKEKVETPSSGMPLALALQIHEFMKAVVDLK